MPEGNTREREARSLGSASCDDLALLEVEDLAGLEPVTLGSSVGLQIGASVDVAGFPFGGKPGTPMTMTSGDIPADGLIELGPRLNLRQYTAATNPGASGAMVVDGAGEVVAIHTAGRGENMNYNLAIDEAMPILKQLAAGQQRDWLGAAVDEVDTSAGEAPLMLSAVAAESPLGKAGAMLGDALVVLGEERIGNEANLCRVLRAEPDRATLPIGLLRLAGEPRANWRARSR